MTDINSEFLIYDIKIIVPDLPTLKFVLGR